jgi:hypothetical protein
MRSLRDYVVGVALIAGCAGTAEPCPRPVGNFVGTYGLLDGTCTRTPTQALSFPDDDKAQTVNRVNSAAGPVNTELNRLGCTVGIKQDWMDQGAKVAIQGQLTVEDGSNLTGQVYYQEYMADGVTMRCQSRLDASYSLQDGIPIGAAAQAALAE